MTLLDHSKFFVSFIGTVTLSSDVVLENVLYMPQFKFNLLSVSALAENSSLCLNFLSHTCVIQDVYHSRMIGKGDLINGLYVIDVGSSLFGNKVVDKGFNSTNTVAHVISRHT